MLPAESNMNYLYLALDLGTIVIPLAFSFGKFVAFRSKWFALWPAILFTGLLFIIWDVWFTKMGVWGFNQEYLLDIKLFELPIEEWLFFICIPYACIFIYESVIYFSKSHSIPKWPRLLAWLLFIFAATVSILNFDRIYTFCAFGFAAFALLIAIIQQKDKMIYYFFKSFPLILLPFFIVNGVLTGSAIPDQVVWYNDTENLNFRLGTIPFDDSFYLLGYLLSITIIYERLLKRF